MRDENLIYAELESGLLRVYPKDGYKMMNKKTRTYCSEAIIAEKNIPYFISEPI